ncbi:amidohydrolase family protein [Streptomyces reniochalinae]|uniref:Hydrolase n=1 Tax=Streptomyces reniochalinae TaxID=2250578 RepID=A0A367E7V9_9ACTN|nr:hydrolase [Streptomyces reniochalinae]RCG14134.1 hydrolase [Streptomyces reniochalinae]
MTDSEPQEPGRAGRAFHHAAPRPSARPAPSLVLCGARLADGRTVDVRLVGERIEAVGTAGSLGRAHESGTRLDLTGYLLLPAPAEPHAHYDTALTAEPPRPCHPGGGPGAPQDPSGTARIAAGPAGSGTDGDPAAPYRARGGADPTCEDIQRRTTEAALLQLGQGATAVRTHVRIGDVAGLRSLEAVLQARRALSGMVDLSTVAVPRLLTGVAGAEGLAMLRDAVKMGAAAVGGCPDLDPDPGGYVEAVLDVAAEHGCPVDLHTDGGDPARLARLAAAAGGLRPRVTIGPCGGLARLPHQVAQRAAGQLAAAGVTVVSLPQGDCGVLERPTPTAPYRMAPVRMLMAAGVKVTAGSGALRDAANEVGRGDPLEAAYLLASRGEARPGGAYEAISARARSAMGLPRVRVEAGFPAELLAVRGTQLAGALSLAYSRIVVHRGRVVARTSAVREYCDLAGARELGLPRQSQG